MKWFMISAYGDLHDLGEHKNASEAMDSAEEQDEGYQLVARETVAKEWLKFLQQFVTPEAIDTPGNSDTEEREVWDE